MAATAEMAAIAARVRPDQVTLVPERPRELTTEGGLDVVAQQAAIADFVRQMGDAGIRVSIFLNPDEAQVKAAKASGAEAIEINTGVYADSPPASSSAELARIARAAALGVREGLEVLAGHGLNYVNVIPIVGVGEIVELNIGHSIVARASLVGMDRAVRDMVALLRR
jgi:pyridoxine 5-phosphate synthase